MPVAVAILFINNSIFQAGRYYAHTPNLPEEFSRNIYLGYLNICQCIWVWTSLLSHFIRCHQTAVGYRKCNSSMHLLREKLKYSQILSNILGQKHHTMTSLSWSGETTLYAWHNWKIDWWISGQMDLYQQAWQISLA